MTPSVSDLGPLVTQALETEGPVWLPGVVGPLAAAAQDALLGKSRIGPEDYGTARVRANDPGAEREEAARIVLPTAFAALGPVIVETLRPGPAQRYVDLGLAFASPSEAAAATPRLSCAIERLSSVPSVARAIGTVLSVVHVVTPEGPDYDVSYSEPTLPFSVFVGIGETAGEHADLRLAEAVLHECMHLQLTLMEAAAPLILHGREERHHSPWQNTMRPAQGVLHGAYVFAVIRDFMRAIAAGDLCSLAEKRHVTDRVDTCDREVSVACVDLLGGESLTVEGRRLVNRLRSPSA